MSYQDYISRTEIMENVEYYVRRAQRSGDKADSDHATAKIMALIDRHVKEKQEWTAYEMFNYVIYTEQWGFGLLKFSKMKDSLSKVVSRFELQKR